MTRYNTFSILLLGIFIGLNVEARPIHSQPEVEIEMVSDSGREFRQFSSEDHSRKHRAYLLAKKGRNYSIRVRNLSGRRIGLVIAVDGCNIISGRKSDLKRNERMYILEPYQ